MKLTPVINAHIRWLEDGQPWSETFGDIYFSRENAEAETTHVFLEGNALAERFSRCKDRFVIAETGFGSGLNFLLSWQLWERHAPPGARLYFISCEQYPLTVEDMARIHSLWPHLSSYALALQKAWMPKGHGLHRLRLGDASRPVLLDLLYGDAGEKFTSLAASHPETTDAWFLDGFAPRSNPGMWSPQLFSAMAKLSHTGTTVATYSVAAPVRQGLTDAGFAFEKAPGFGNKRHMLRAHCTKPAANEPRRPLSSARQRDAQVCIIGGGLAGCATAHALSLKGIDSQLIESGQSLAGGASGNPVGVMFLPLHREPSQKTLYLTASYLFARRSCELLAEQHPEISWNPVGALQLTRKNSEDYFERVADNPAYWPELVTHLMQEAAEQIAGIPLGQDALHLPMTATVSPQGLCQAYTQSPLCRVRTGIRASRLERYNDTWRVLDDAGACISETPHIVIANSREALTLLPEQDYPLSPNRGQLTMLKESEASASLNTVLCGRGYLSPAVDGQHVCGGSFNPADESLDPRDSDDARNIGLLKDLVPAIGNSFTNDHVVAHRAAQRCTTRDYLPLAGRVETADAAFSASPLSMDTHPGLYLLTGLGSHGITTSALAAEYLASLITGDPLPLTLPQAELITPSRFRWRRLRKGP